MTALDKYVRLESDGLWRPAPEAQRRQVTVCFGDATLVITDQAGRPLAHWSLPALIRINDAKTQPALYAPDPEGSEMLEIDDDLMIAAIEDVRRALVRRRPRQGSLRHWITAGIALAIVAAAVVWLPAAALRQTLAVLPAATRSDIGATILSQIETRTGPACRGDTGETAARLLAARVFGAGTNRRIVVLPDLQQAALAMPGGLILLDGRLLRAADDPAAVAGFVLAAQAAFADQDPLAPVLAEAGLAATLRLLTTGDLAPDILRRHADKQLERPAPVADAAVLRTAFAAAALPQAAYLALVARRGSPPPDLGADPVDPQTAPPVMPDSAWISLQNICNR